MGWQGEFNIGELCRTAYRDDAALIGFGTDRGTVAAVDDWGGRMQIKRVLPSRPDSFERVFRPTGIARSLTDLRDPKHGEMRKLLSKPCLERAIGVVYRPETEIYSHYFEAVLSEQFDAYVWFEETRAITPCRHRGRRESRTPIRSACSRAKADPASRGRNHDRNASFR